MGNEWPGRLPKAAGDDVERQEATHRNRAVTKSITAQGSRKQDGRGTESEEV